jgi:2-oxoglutarate dehydrogenase E2 component (dihydrolipoamide succinyltransferase)
MALELLVPHLGESVTEATIAAWRKRDGEAVAANEPLVELETDKANVEVRADRAGTLRILKKEGAVKVGDVIATIEEAAGTAPRGDGGTAAPAPAAPVTARPAPAAPAPASPAPGPGSARR